MVEYYIKFYYIYDKLKDAKQPAPDSEDISDFISDIRYSGIIFKSNNINDIYSIINFLKGDNYAQIHDLYVISRYNDFFVSSRNNLNQLKILYEQVPNFVLQQMPNDDLWNDLLSLIQYDDKGVLYFTKDASNAVINCICGFQHSKFLFDKFKENPQMIIHIYHNLDGKYYDSDESQVITSYQSSKMSFVSILTVLCLLNRESTTIKKMLPLKLAIIIDLVFI